MTPDPSPEILDACAQLGRQCRDMAIAAEAESYVRARVLPELLDVLDAEIENESVLGTELIILRLERAVKASAEAGAADHESYRSNRHFRLLGALKAERTKLANLLNAKTFSRLIEGVMACR